jgi:integrase
LQGFSSAVGPGTRFCCIGELDLEEYRSHTLGLPVCPHTGRRISPETGKGRLTAVRTFYRWAYKMYLLDRLPRNVDDLARMPSNGHLPVRVYSFEELKAFWKSASSRLRCWIALALNCGFGQQDIAELRCSEVDWDHGTIERERSKTQVKAKFKLWPLAPDLLKKHRNP